MITTFKMRLIVILNIMSFTFLVVEGTVEGEFNSVDWSEFNSEEAIDYIAFVFDKFEQKMSEKVESVKMGMHVYFEVCKMQ